MQSVIEHYQANYCEENIWHLCRLFTHPEQCATVVFISNRQQQVALYGQITAKAPGMPVVWDYHVVLCVFREGGWGILDPDYYEGPSVGLNEYIERTFPETIPADFRAMFRLIPGEEYCQTLRTDRRHMRQVGTWLSPPPPWPCIGEGSNLMDIVDFDCPDYADALTLDAFKRHFSAPPTVIDRNQATKY
ncbi:MAG: hypothetical protein JKY76_01870 [Proteobacteria bacterium]|nr:hypothetical protein [Pseudomonadota bacterium]